MKLFIIVFLVCLAMVTSEDAKKRWKEIKKEEKKIIVKEEENFKVGDIVTENTGDFFELVSYKEFREERLKKGYTCWQREDDYYYGKSIKGDYYATLGKKSIRKATKIEEFIFKNGGKENE